MEDNQCLQGVAIGECLMALRERRHQGRDDRALAERLYGNIATADSIILQVNGRNWQTLFEAGRALKGGALQPDKWPAAPSSGLRQSYEWVARQWELLLPSQPVQGNDTLRVILTKPRPVIDLPSVTIDIPLGRQLVNKSVPPGAVLAQTTALNMAGQPRCQLVLRKDRMLALVSGQSHNNYPDSLSACQAEQLAAITALDASPTLRAFVARYNASKHGTSKLQFSGIGTQDLVQNAALSPLPPLSHLERRLQCSYKALGEYTDAAKSDALKSLIPQFPEVHERLKAACLTAKALEQRHLHKAANTWPSGRCGTRPGLLQGCAAQLLMDTVAAVERRAGATTQREGCANLCFNTPLARTASLLRPFEQAVLQSMCTDISAVSDFVRKHLTSTQCDAVREAHGTITKLVKELLAATHASVTAAISSRSGRPAETNAPPGDMAWPNIGMHSGLPMAILSLRSPAAHVTAEAARPRPASPTATAGQAYLDAAQLLKSFDASLDAALEQPAWLQQFLNGEAPFSRDDSGPQALPYTLPNTPLGNPVPAAHKTPGVTRANLADRTDPGGRSGRQAAPPLTAANFQLRMDQFVSEIKTPGNWEGFSAELGPHFLVDCQAWPGHRSLEIVDRETGQLRAKFGNTSPGVTPAIVALKNSHYSPVLNGRLLTAPTNGDCFYYSILMALGKADGPALLDTIGVPPDGSMAQATKALREHFGGHLDWNRDDYEQAIIKLYSEVES
ncbi:hypothetical protein [Roseateles sp. YR242]|uniref:hypothetical protein n=1 Tax=Roseateles sp. YR242 TaxID=1855305 RepID=UPI000B82C505|nr:hypothetical protein [Roseateles sp. YR242]